MAQESIRVNALKSAPAVFKAIPLVDGSTGLGYLNCAYDKSWRVRSAVAESIVGVVASLQATSGSDVQNFDEQLDQAADIFMSLLTDVESEVRISL